MGLGVGSRLAAGTEARARAAAARGLHAAAAYREAQAATSAGEGAYPRERPSSLARLRAHPYVRLALNGSFSALWVGQVISLFGDRVNQIALAAFVYEVTDSPLAVALTFFVGTIPNLIFSPDRRRLVDRWDQKQVLVVSDILRAAAGAAGPGRGPEQRLARLPARVR